VQTPEGGLQININPSSDEESEEEPEEGSEEGSEEELPAEDLAEYGDEHPIATKDAVNKLDEEGKVDEYGDEHPIATKDAVNKLKETADEMIKEEEPVFEVEISEEDTAALAEMSTEKEEEETNEANENSKEKELHESLVVMRKKYQEIVAENNKKTKELEGFKTLAEEFKGSEADYKSAIKNLKSQLQEVALFSSNLTYAIKLITENSTTKDEKLEILKRFDGAKNLNESREIFNSMQSQFSSNKTATKQMVEEKIMETPKASGSSKLNESTAYTNPQLDRIREIIGKI
jgi:hypothetical protein